MSVAQGIAALMLCLLLYMCALTHTAEVPLVTLEMSSQAAAHTLLAAVLHLLPRVASQHGVEGVRAVSGPDSQVPAQVVHLLIPGGFHSYSLLLFVFVVLVSNFFLFDIKIYTVCLFVEVKKLKLVQLTINPAECKLL